MSIDPTLSAVARSLAWHRTHFESFTRSATDWIVREVFVTGRPGPFQFARPGSLARALASAGFVDIEERIERNDWVWPGDARSFWDFMQATSAGALAANETEAALARLRVFERGDTLGETRSSAGSASRDRAPASEPVAASRLRADRAARRGAGGAGRDGGT